MKNDLLSLNELEKDALKEVGNIGAGNAATAFAQLLDRKINMTVPSIKILPLTSVQDMISNEEQQVAGILLKIMGEAPGRILLILPEDSIKLLTEILDGKVMPDGINEFQISLFKEIGNILSGSYLSSINKITGFNLIQSVPGFSYDMAAAILSSSLISLGRVSDYVLFIETKFMDGEDKIDAFFFLIPEVGSLQKILNGLGLDSNG